MLRRNEYNKIIDIIQTLVDFHNNIDGDQSLIDNLVYKINEYFPVNSDDDFDYRSIFLFLIGRDILTIYFSLDFRKQYKSYRFEFFDFYLLTISQGIILRYDEYVAVYQQPTYSSDMESSFESISDLCMHYPGKLVIYSILLDLNSSYASLYLNIMRRICQYLYSFSSQSESCKDWYRLLEYAPEQLVIGNYDLDSYDSGLSDDFESDDFASGDFEFDDFESDDFDTDDSNVSETIEDPFTELDNLIGLQTVKQDVVSLANFIKIKKLRELKGLKSAEISYHCVFTGNPGTGKTTVARILAGIFRDLGVLRSGHLVETDRSGLVAEYVGQTAVKTNRIIDSALDGVLFIDEAYSLVGGQNDFGKEAIATLLKRMEDDRDRLIVILAGYSNEMEEFINSNPGLRSRFNRYIYFPDYSSTELYDIFKLNVEKNEYVLTNTASEYLKKQLDTIVSGRIKDFGNARFVRNYFELSIQHQANRLASSSYLSDDAISKITIEDVQTIPGQIIKGVSDNKGFK